MLQQISPMYINKSFGFRMLVTKVHTHDNHGNQMVL